MNLPDFEPGYDFEYDQQLPWAQREKRMMSFEDGARLAGTSAVSLRRWIKQGILKPRHAWQARHGQWYFDMARLRELANTSRAQRMKMRGTVHHKSKNDYERARWLRDNETGEHWENLSFKEIALICGVSTATINHWHNYDYLGPDVARWTDNWWRYEVEGMKAVANEWHEGYRGTERQAGSRRQNMPWRTTLNRRADRAAAEAFEKEFGPKPLVQSDEDKEWARLERIVCNKIHKAGTNVGYRAPRAKKGTGT